MYIILDAVDSHKKIDRKGAIKKMEKLGVNFTTVEGLIYEYLGNFGSKHMKNMVPILKTERKFPISRL